MKTIPLKKAFALLEKASAIIVDNDFVVYPELNSLNGEKDHEFIAIAWNDAGIEDESFYRFTEGMNRLVEYSENAIFLIDKKNVCYEITLLKPQKL